MKCVPISLNLPFISHLLLLISTLHTHIILLLRLKLMLWLSFLLTDMLSLPIGKKILSLKPHLNCNLFWISKDIYLYGFILFMHLFIKWLLHTALSAFAMAPVIDLSTDGSLEHIPECNVHFCIFPFTASNFILNTCSSVLQLAFCPFFFS